MKSDKDTFVRNHYEMFNPPTGLLNLKEITIYYDADMIIDKVWSIEDD